MNEELNEELNEEIEDENIYKSDFFEWIEALIIAIFAVIFIFLFVARPVGVDGSSMEPTLQHGDNLILSNLLYTPEIGDIVVLTKDTFENGEKSIVKRIIAKEGQEVDIDFINGDVYIDGEIIDEPYIKEKTYLEEGLQLPAIIPEGHVFVMGDNRNNSKDSRSVEIGMVPIDCILGRAVFRFLPFDSIGVVQ